MTKTRGSSLVLLALFARMLAGLDAAQADHPNILWITSEDRFNKVGSR